MASIWKLNKALFPEKRVRSGDEGKARPGKQLPAVLDPSNVDTERTIYVDVTKLPSFTGLQSEVFSVMKKSPWFTKYGHEWMALTFAVCGYITGMHLLSRDNLVIQTNAVLLMALCHSIIGLRVGHTVSHSNMCQSELINKLLGHVVFDLYNGYPLNLVVQDHVKVHHPHTNIIGLGDSRCWRAESVPREIYMLFGGFFLPILAPLEVIRQLLTAGKSVAFVRFVVLYILFMSLHVILISHFSGLSIPVAIITLWLIRGIPGVPFIHVNIFQHIGLPMWSPKNRPSRIYQMSNSVLNLERHWLLDFAFGHSLINCHVEHHLFPKLSDNMCLVIKPLVKRYLEKNDLPYHTRPYAERFQYFWEDYDTLMAKGPPLTHFVSV